VRTSIRQAAIYDEYVAYLRDEHGANLVSHWPLDEGPGATTARDVVGGYDGTHNGGVSPGYGGVVRGLETATRYDGSTGYTDVGDQSAHDVGSSDDLTILMWMRMTEPVATVTTPIAKWSGVAGPILDLRDDGEARFFLEDGQGDFVSALARSIIYDGDRHLIAAVADRAADECYLYQDDVRQITQDISAIGDISSAASLNIGRRSDGINYVSQRIGHVSWLETALTDDEIADIARVGLQGLMR